MVVVKGRYNRRLRIERSVRGSGLDSAGSDGWAPVGTTWAEVQDVLPSRSERLADGINVASRPARVRMPFRTDISPSMRLCLLRRHDGEWIVDRVMQIVAGPAELGNRDAVEFMVEDYTSAGNG